MILGITREEIQILFEEFQRKYPYEVECCQSAADFLSRKGFPRGKGKFDVDYAPEEPTPIHHWNYLIRLPNDSNVPDNYYHNKAPILDFTAFQYTGQIGVVIPRKPLMVGVGAPLYQRYRAWP
jgi:hypothetical protein